ncbi:MAG TPA: hypothetical protein DCQ94_06790 [Nitrospira sp.]|nr:hypothetical protein [Nitrospira sp.]
MHVQKESMTKLSSAALAPNRLLKLSGGKWAYAGPGDLALAVSAGRTYAADEPLAGEFLANNWTFRIGVAATVTQFADVYQAANGTVSMVPSGRYVGIALEAATAIGQEIEILPKEPPLSKPVTAHTADATLTAAQSGTVHTTVGATGTVVLTLPPATLGLDFPFRVGAAQELRLDPDGTEKISLPSTGVPGAAGKYLTANADGETVHLLCTKAGEWSVIGFTGTWTAEP